MVGFKQYKAEGKISEVEDKSEKNLDWSIERQNDGEYQKEYERHMEYWVKLSCKSTWSWERE